MRSTMCGDTRQINGLLRGFVPVTLCLLVAVWLAVYTLGDERRPKNQSAAPKPFASRDISFTAVKKAAIHLHGTTVTATYRVYHVPPDKWRIEYLAPADVRGRVMIRNGDTVWQLEPLEKRIFVTTGDVGVEDYERIDALLTRNYAVKPVSGATAAGRACRVLRLTPKHEGKSSWVIWVDDEIGNILKREKYDADGRLVMESEFTEFHPGHVGSDVFDVVRLPRYEVVNRTWGIRRLDNAEIRRLSGIKPPSRLPGGFELRSACRVSGRPDALQLTYSDGLSAASLFICAGHDYEKPISKSARRITIGSARGRAETYGSMTSFYWGAGGRSYTLIADIGEHVMLDIAKSLL